MDRQHWLGKHGTAMDEGAWESWVGWKGRGSETG